ncbi:mtr1 Ribosome quality control complex subunit 2 [Candida maltosa Xu316]|uniref:Ribosome quality control complex subunit 2 n=1 Tax=Candida maltosa (strain Xu316) TaxID=1245528 RepID=M3IR81_CANMX|nr:hypothetical protein G210_0292 [Candida maltosa Xu316]
MKQRITSLDLQILTSELSKEILNYRLQNIYNVASNSRQYLFKFSIPDSKKVLVLEYGNRIHLTEFDRPTTQQPTNFVTKLRKHLKTRRLSGIKQIGNDRVLVLEFSDGKYYLVLEFFSAGNILLLDEGFKILSLQRLVSAKEDNDRYAVNEEYKMFDKSLFQSDFHYEKRHYTAEEIESWIKLHKEKLSQTVDKKKAKVFSIHKLAFVNASHLSGELIQKWFHESGVDPTQSCLVYENDEQGIQKVIDALDVCEEKYLQLINGQAEINGVIVAKKNSSTVENTEFEYIYDEFHPFKPYKPNTADLQLTEIEGYNKTLDKFFSTIESSKFTLKIEQQKENAAKRLEKAKSERTKQIEVLIAQEEANAKKGELIQYHAELVEECRSYVQSFLDQQMDWTNIETFIGLEQKKNKPLAKAIQLPLNLKENKFKILLEDFDDYFDDIEEESASATETESESESDESESESDSDDDDDDIPVKRVKKERKAKSVKAPKTVPVWIDLSLTAFANARSYFDCKKTAETKRDKVVHSSKLALQNAERKINQDLAKNLKTENEPLNFIKPKYWFEKFFWFVSSEGYLCLAGKDDSQIDMIYYRHFSDNDSLVSSDVEGSLKVFIKNPFKGEAIPPSTLMQAGIFSMSGSSAWNGKVTTSAWVLHGTEISKRDFDGSLVSPGEFNYLAKKEYLPPVQLVMGLGLYCLVDEDATKRYSEVRAGREQEHGLTIVMDNKKKELEEIKNSKQDILSEKEVGEPENGRNDDVEEEEQEEEIDSDAVSVADSQTDKQKGSTPVPRGKKSKLKKIAARYADQDEEERKLRMDALGTLKQLENRGSPKPSEVSAKDEAIKKIQDREAALKRKEKQKERELQKYLNMEDEDTNDESHITNYLEILDSFAPKPSANDKIISMVPVFAPWAALQKFKYKVKIQPGTGKKGKCIGDALNYFTTRKMDTSNTDRDLDWPQERELIKSFKSNDMVGLFTVGKVKLVLPGGANDSKSGGKSASKASGKKGGASKKGSKKK